MPKTTKSLSEGHRTFGVRLYDDELKRYMELWQKVKKKYHFITKSELNRELLGLTKNVALTDDDIRYFKTGEK